MDNIRVYTLIGIVNISLKYFKLIILINILNSKLMDFSKVDILHLRVCNKYPNLMCWPINLLLHFILTQ